MKNLKSIETIKLEMDNLNVLKATDIDSFYKDACSIVKSLFDLSLRAGSVDPHGSIKHQDFFDKFKKLGKLIGLEVLGSGYFSAAVKFKAIEGKVIKIGFKKEDSGAAYAAYCRKNKDSKHLVTIDYVNRFNNCYMVVMPEYCDYRKTLKAGTLNHEDVMLMRGCFRLANLILSYTNRYGAYSYNKLIGKLFQELTNFNEGLSDARKVLEFLDNKEEYLRNFIKECKAIQGYFIDLASFDLHDENIMISFDKETNEPTLIITDPVSYSNDESNESFGTSLPKAQSETSRLYIK